MTLSALMRKGGLREVATAIPATAATEEGKRVGTVARVATVAVATPPITESNTTAAMTANEEKAIRAWLEHIEEADAAIIAVVLDRCRVDAGARDYFIGRSGELSKPDPFPDDRRTCNQCANLIGLRCHSAKRGEIVASRNYEPIRDLPLRCEGYVPGMDDPDKRLGGERWPGLIQKGGE